MLTADQLLARLYALRKDYADDPEDETYQALTTFCSFRIAWATSRPISTRSENRMNED